PAASRCPSLPTRESFPGAMLAPLPAVATGSPHTHSLPPLPDSMPAPTPDAAPPILPHYGLPLALPAGKSSGAPHPTLPTQARSPRTWPVHPVSLPDKWFALPANPPAPSDPVSSQPPRSSWAHHSPKMVQSAN